jgi:hypothetical protein
VDDLENMKEPLFSWALHGKHDQELENVEQAGRNVDDGVLGTRTGKKKRKTTLLEGPPSVSPTIKPK